MTKDQKKIQEMLADIRAAIARCIGLSEAVVLEALLSEADGWKMRMEELNQESE